MSQILALDPASNRTGVAVFLNGTLRLTKTITTNAETPLSRRLSIAHKIKDLIESNNFDEVTSEEPLLLGRNNSGMQRLLGMIEAITKGKVNFIHPMSVKKFCGSGKLDKIEVALAAGNKLKTEKEKEILADAIAREAWDESDAVAIGLTYLEKSK